MSGSYEAIPDVESGVVSGDGKTSAERAKEKYPEANDLEAKFLGFLDDAIDNAEPTISLDAVSPADVRGSGTEGGGGGMPPFLNALKLPTAALVFVILLTFGVVAIHSSGLTLSFPFVACVIIVGASFVPTRDRFLKAVDPAFEMIDGTKGKVDDKVKGCEDMAKGYVNDAEGAFNDAISPMKSKLDLATKAEAMLKRIDPSIDIPDLSDIERSFDGFEDQITNAFASLGGMLNIDQFIPYLFTSRFVMQLFVLYPFVLIFLILQIVVTLVATLFLFAGSATKANEWELISFALITYIIAATQVGLTFLLTSPAVIARQINGFLKKVTGKVNTSLDQATGPIFVTVFKDGFGGIRDQMLAIMSKIQKLEAPLAKVKLPGGLKLPAGLPGAAKITQNLQDKIPTKIPDNLPGVGGLKKFF